MGTPARLLTAILGAALLLAPMAARGQTSPAAWVVARVIDGDTVDVTTPDGRRERVRVISKTSRPCSLSGGMNST